jgi:hypothetical protein
VGLTSQDPPAPTAPVAPMSHAAASLRAAPLIGRSGSGSFGVADGDAMSGGLPRMPSGLRVASERLQQVRR